MRHEQSSPSVMLYDHAVTLAHEANAAYDREKAAICMQTTLQIYATVLGIEISQDIRNTIMAEIVSARTDHWARSDAVGALIGPAVFTETNDIA